ncbi:hypothetical protein HYR99_14980, partial [Candidatus Poribacteria bacterium]|nr:hypothetical protein [Candidatus Poribacteria bacterium]
FVFRQLTRVFSSYLGQSNLPGFPYFHEQSAGAWLCLFLIAMWMTRRHLVTVFRTAFSSTSPFRPHPLPLSPARLTPLPLSTSVWRGGEGGEARGVRGEGGDDADEPMRYRTAIFGLLGGFLFLTAFCHEAGMSIAAVLLFFGLYFAIAIAITRLRAEFGAPHGVFNHPLDIMVTCFGSMTWGTRNLTVMTFFQWFNRSYRSHPMPNQFEGLKIAEAVNINNRRLVVAMMAASVVALISGIWTNLDMLYRDGAIARVPFFKMWVADGAFRQLESWLYHAVPPDGARISFMGIGAAVTLILFILRLRLFWWPLHPVSSVGR